MSYIYIYVHTETKINGRALSRLSETEPEQNEEQMFLKMFEREKNESKFLFLKTTPRMYIRLTSNKKFFILH